MASGRLVEAGTEGPFHPHRAFATHAVRPDIESPHRQKDEFGLRSCWLCPESRPDDVLGLRRPDFRHRNRVVDRLGWEVFEGELRRERLEPHRVLAGDLLESEASVDRVAHLPRYRMHVELTGRSSIVPTARGDFRLDPPERQAVEKLPDDPLVRDHEHPSAEPVSRVLRRLHEREAKGEPGDALRRAPTRIEADRRIPVHLPTIDVFDTEQTMLGQLPQENCKEPAVDHDLRADLLRTVEARPIVEEAENPQADPFLDIGGGGRRPPPGRCRGPPAPAGRTVAPWRSRPRPGPRRFNFPGLLFSGGPAPGG